MNRKKGFTLIELLAVIIILGILLLIAIPSVTNYINNSRKEAYITTAKELIKGATNLVNSGDLDIYDTDITYYIPTSCINVETGGNSPYGKFDPAYILVTYDNSSFDYYWLSRDDQGIGIKIITPANDLKSSLIVSGIKREDINTDKGIGNRSKIVEFNEDCSNKLDPKPAEDNSGGTSGNEYKPICKRATSLHTEKCDNSAWGCFRMGYSNGETITYGQLGTPGILRSGDAFDCDVNGDGTYDSVNERFYYVSPYYDTYSLNFDSSYAVLIASKDYYQSNNSSNGTREYDSSNSALYGPRTAVTHLPTINEWRKVSLKTTTRNILAEWRESHNVKNIGATLPTDFEYSFNGVNNAARLITAQEVMNGCGLSQACTFTIGDLGNCEYLFEATSFAKYNNSVSAYIYETPLASNHSSSSQDCILSTVAGEVSLTNTCRLTGRYGIRPVIDVPIIDMDY